MNGVYLTKSAKTLIFNEIPIQFFRLMLTPKSHPPSIGQFADLHCHTSILPFSYSFAPKQPHPRGNIWHSHQVNFLRKCVKWSTGIPWFTQADLSAMAKGNMRLAIVALCPPEKQFLFDTFGRGPLSAAMCNLVMGIGYHRVRQVQREMDYFRELCGEYEFFIQSQRERPIGEKVYRWRPARMERKCRRFCLPTERSRYCSPLREDMCSTQASGTWEKFRRRKKYSATFKN